MVAMIGGRSSGTRLRWVAAVAIALLAGGCSRATPPDRGAQSTSSAQTTAARSSSAASTSAPTSSPPASSTAVPPPASSTRPSSSAPPGPVAALLGREWTRIPTGRRVVALTFDAGANADGLPAILATLAAKQVPATFFLTGNWVSNYPAQARQVGAGYRLGNHSVSHPHFPELTDAEIRGQVTGAASSIRRVAGADPAPWFRFPFGDRDSRTIAVVNAAGYVPIGWTVDTLGWQGTGAGITGERILQRVLGALTPGEIVLMHVGSNPDDHSTLDATTLPRLIDALRARGYGFVTLDAMLG